MDQIVDEKFSQAPSNGCDHEHLVHTTAVNVLKFKEFNSIYTRLTRASRQKYYDEKFIECSNDCKKT